MNSGGFGELSKDLQAFRDLPLSGSLPAHSLPLFVPIFPRSDPSSPRAHSRPRAFTFPLGTGLFLLLIQLPQPWIPAFGTAWPLLSASPGDFGLSSRCHSGIWYLAKHQVNSPAASQMPTNPVCPTEPRACCCAAGPLWCHTGGEDTRTRLCISIHAYSSSRHDHILKRATLLHAVGKPVHL